MNPLLPHLGRSGASSGFALGLIWDLGLCRGGWWAGKANRTFPVDAAVLGHRVPCVSHPGINKPGHNSHPGLSWTNKCLWGMCWESPAGLGIGELNTPARPGCAQALISPWGWMFAWPEGTAAHFDTGVYL